MDKPSPILAMTKLIEILGPLSTEDRARAIRASLILLGDADVKSSLIEKGQGAESHTSEPSTLAVRARTWIKQNSISEEQLQEIFYMTKEGVEIIATHIPGKSKKEQTYNAYLLVGIGQLLLSGTPSFNDKSARVLCESAGCYDAANHSAYMKDKGNEFTGSKEKGWTLTAPGLKRAAELVKELARAHD